LLLELANAVPDAARISEAAKLLFSCTSSTSVLTGGKRRNLYPFRASTTSSVSRLNEAGPCQGGPVCEVEKASRLHVHRDTGLRRRLDLEKSGVALPDVFPHRRVVRQVGQGGPLTFSQLEAFAGPDRLLHCRLAGSERTTGRTQLAPLLEIGRVAKKRAGRLPCLTARAARRLSRLVS
jgi:hypothetical protein